jgi:hypothetical protein
VSQGGDAATGALIEALKTGATIFGAILLTLFAIADGHRPFDIAAVAVAAMRAPRVTGGGARSRPR